MKFIIFGFIFTLSPTWAVLTELRYPSAYDVTVPARTQTECMTEVIQGYPEARSWLWMKNGSCKAVWFNLPNPIQDPKVAAMDLTPTGLGCSAARNCGGATSPSESWLKRSSSMDGCRDPTPHVSAALAFTWGAPGTAVGGQCYGNRVYGNRNAPACNHPTTFYWSCQGRPTDAVHRNGRDFQIGCATLDKELPGIYSNLFDCVKAAEGLTDNSYFRASYHKTTRKCYASRHMGNHNEACTGKETEWVFGTMTTEHKRKKELPFGHEYAFAGAFNTTDATLVAKGIDSITRCDQLARYKYPSVFASIRYFNGDCYAANNGLLESPDPVDGSRGKVAVTLVNDHHLERGCGRGNVFYLGTYSTFSECISQGRLASFDTVEYGVLGSPKASLCYGRRNLDEPNNWTPQTNHLCYGGKRYWYYHSYRTATATTTTTATPPPNTSPAMTKSAAERKLCCINKCTRPRL